MISGISWNRSILNISFSEGNAPEGIYIASGNKMVPLEMVETEGKIFATLNLCVSLDGTMLEEGEWLFLNGSASAKKSEENENCIQVSDEALRLLEEASRIFRYDKDYAYLVSFAPKSDGTGLVMRTDFVMRNPNPRKRDAKKNLIKAGVDRAYNLFRKNNKKGKLGILFLSETRDEPSDNFRALGNRMLERGLGDKYPIDWYLRNNVKRGLSPEKRLELIKKIAAYDYIVIDDYVPTLSVLDLAPEVKVLQLWHAGFGYKLVGYARFGRDGSPHPYQSCHRKYTYAVVGNEELKPVYTEVFGVPEDRLIATGMPRLEHFLDEDIVTKKGDAVLSKYPNLIGKRIILFAPTYRGMNQKEAYYDYSKINQKALYDYCQKTDSVVVFKFHHFIESGLIIDAEFEDRLIDLSNEGLEGLMYVSHALITDYSSCFYDYLLLDRPILFYVFDEEEYDLTRGVHYNVSKTCPGIVCKSPDELINGLENCDEMWKGISAPEYMKDQCLTNGDYGACDRIIDTVFEGGNY